MNVIVCMCMETKKKSILSLVKSFKDLTKKNKCQLQNKIILLHFSLIFRSILHLEDFASATQGMNV